VPSMECFWKTLTIFNTEHMINSPTQVGYGENWLEIGSDAVFHLHPLCDRGISVRENIG
jgi:hypothetical protein